MSCVRCLRTIEIRLDFVLIGEGAGGEARLRLRVTVEGAPPLPCDLSPINKIPPKYLY